MVDIKDNDALEETPAAAGETVAEVVEETLATHDEEHGGISEAFLEAVQDAIERADSEALKRLTEDLHEADLADLIEALRAPERARLVELLGSDFDFVALTELDETLRVKLLEALPSEVVAAGVSELESDDAELLIRQTGGDRTDHNEQHEDLHRRVTVDHACRSGDQRQQSPECKQHA